METRTINVRYDWGGTVVHRLEKLENNTHCPGCGHNADQWIDRDSHDYYLGCTCYCLVCGATFGEPNLFGESPQAEQIAAELRGTVAPQEVILPKPRTGPLPDYEKAIRESWVPGIQNVLDNSIALLGKIERKGD